MAGKRKETNVIKLIIKTKSKKINLIYILCAGRSGSTLLDLLLGSHSKIFGMGEITHLAAYLKLNWECGCGVRISECDFWASILDKVSGSLSIRQSQSPRFNKAEKCLQLLKLDYSLDDILNHARIEYEIFQNILDKTNKEWLVDSSKDLSRLLYLKKSGLFNIKVVYLLRDGRGYVYSRIKIPYLKTLSARNKIPVPVFTSSLEWMKKNLLNYYVIRLLLKKDDWIMVSYEALANNPRCEVQRVCAMLGVHYEEDIMSHFSKRMHHNIGGNRMRFNKNQGIKIDEGWKYNLTNNQKLTFYLIAGLFNKFLEVMFLHERKNKWK